METEHYFRELREKIDLVYKIAREARALGLDPSREVDALPAGDLAARVEGLVGPPGIADKIREYGRDNLTRIMDEVLGEVAGLSAKDLQARIEQSLRTALAIQTEGVVAAPIEGISKIEIKENPDGSKYLAIYFSGPIRSAGGTAQGLAVLFGDYLRRKAGLKEYRPTGDEVERYVEEIKTYNDRVTRLQYKPSDDDIRTIVNSCPVCVEGDPTEKREVAIHRNLERVATNRIRGGMCLVTAEGIAQKARKLLKYNEAFGLDWTWLSELGKKASSEKQTEKKPATFMSEIVGGRPIFSEPAAKGGFRLRYGKGRTTCIASKSIHPATMIMLDGFIATGTQVKMARPGKGCIITECDTIEGPIIRLLDGSVVRVESVKEAEKLREDMDEILFLGDILINLGDFLQTNSPLLPAGYCEEWWALEVEKAGLKPSALDPDEQVKFSTENKIPLHPRYTYHWDDVSCEDVKSLACWLVSGDLNDCLSLKNTNPEAKKVLEFLGVPHRIADNKVVIDEYKPLLCSLGLLDSGKISLDRFSATYKEDIDSLSLVNLLAPFPVRPKSGTYIGARMGRPEKARERKMQPPVHSLFPIGDAGGAERNISLATQRGVISVESSRYECPGCGRIGTFPRCSECGADCVLKRICPSCGRPTQEETCPACKTTTQGYELRDINLKGLWMEAVEKLGFSRDVKGVKGMISFYKVPEPLEKGMLRSKHDVFVFKDGTIRFDATDAPLTQFRPREVAVSIEKLMELGYTHDYLGAPLSSEEQILELKVQDVILPDPGAEYLMRVSRFMDDLLVKFYGMDSFYNVASREDLLGHLLVGLAPHTSAGITGRIIGFCPAAVCYAHPFWHAAKRRNCDGDEDAVMLFLDAVINFSRMYLPETRGGKMDAPLVITTILDPKEVDDEAHKVEIGFSYPLEFYEKSWQNLNSSDVKIPLVSDILESDPYHQIGFTHDSSGIRGPVLQSTYVTLDSMAEKVEAQLKVAENTRAIDESVVAELVINSHFLRDTYGNLRAFSRQKFRCVKCNQSYRRVPLAGHCLKCGGRLLLTVTEGSIRKYLDISINMADKYSKSDYLKQRLQVLKKNVDSVFTNDLSKQMSLSDFM